MDETNFYKWRSPLKNWCKCRARAIEVQLAVQGSEEWHVPVKEPRGLGIKAPECLILFLNYFCYIKKTLTLTLGMLKWTSSGDSCDAINENLSIHSLGTWLGTLFSCLVMKTSNLWISSTAAVAQSSALASKPTPLDATLLHEEIMLCWGGLVHERVAGLVWGDDSSSHYDHSVSNLCVQGWNCPKLFSWSWQWIYSTDHHSHQSHTILC